MISRDFNLISVYNKQKQGKNRRKNAQKSQKHFSNILFLRILRVFATVISLPELTLFRFPNTFTFRKIALPMRQSYLLFRQIRVGDLNLDFAI